MRRSNRSAGAGIAAIVAIILVTGGTGLALFMQHEKTRELTSWRNTLDITADTRTREVGQWVQTRFKELTALSENASLQIYFTQLPADEAAADEPPAQAQYLRSLLALTAQRLEFEPTAPSLSQQVGASIGTPEQGGLALVDRNGKLLVSTARMPKLDEAIITAAPKGEASLIDIATTDDGKQTVGFIVPVYGVQAERSAANQIGSIVGITPLNDSFYGMLATQSGSMKTLEVALLRSEGDSARYLTPLRDKSPLMSRREEGSNSAAASAIAAPEQFGVKPDYRSTPVLFTAREVPNTPWTLIAKIDRSEALGAGAQWRNTVIAAVSLLMLALIASIIGIWRNASARQSARAANEAGARAELLAAVANHQPEPLYIVDAEQRIWFANRQAAELMQAKPADLRGKELGSAIGAAYAQSLAPAIERTLEEGTAQAVDLQRGKAKAPRTINARLVPLAHIPVAGLPEPTPGVLVVEQDVTDALSEREHRSQTLQQLVQVIVSRIDRRDPHAAEHSAKVATLAAGTARSMGLDGATIDTTETAARLMNLGKMDIPAEWLTRSGKLNTEERATIRNAVATSADLLSGIAFTGPVAETLRQSQEFVDGSGPAGKKGDQILISARIIAAANALVGMLSTRAWRDGMKLDEAMQTLQQSSGKQFDRKVISAMSNYLDNLGGAETMASEGKSTKKVG